MHDDSLDIGGRRYAPADVLAALGPLLSPARWARIEAVAAARTRRVIPVLDGLADPRNVCAVLRTAEALGGLELHVVTRGLPLRMTSTAGQGAEKWVEVRRWAAPDACAAHFAGRGYRLAAVHAHPEAIPVEALTAGPPLALVFGNEHAGLSPEMQRRADLHVQIPMPGFSRSLNVSVAAGIVLHRAHAAFAGAAPDLSPAEQRRLMAVYCLRSVPRAARLLARLLPDAPPTDAQPS